LTDLVVARPEGLWCEAGGFHIDPWRPVERALITHAHADHARPGHRHYLCAAQGEGVMRRRLGEISLQTLGWGARQRIGDVAVSFHPAGHALGAAQIRIEHRGEIWTLSGDYRVEADRSCAAFEPVRSHVFVTESTFGLPVYRWAPQARVIEQILHWWADNAREGRASLLGCYAFGKAQRLLAGIADAVGHGEPGANGRVRLAAAPGPIVCHGAIESINDAYCEAGVALPETASVLASAASARPGAGAAGALVLAPPSALAGPWARRFGDAADAFVSGWMQLRGVRRRRGVDRGFVLSDHADWPGLQQAIAASQASRVIVTHGYEAVMVRWLREQGLQAQSFATEFGGEPGAEGE
jgi:putative mRNA 3-end processing factor